MFRLLLPARESVRRAVEKRRTSFSEWTARRINIVCDAIIEKGLAFHQRNPRSNEAKARGRPPRRTGHNLLIRMHDDRGGLGVTQKEVLRFP
jgi:hypothetical protein